MNLRLIITAFLIVTACTSFCQKNKTDSLRLAFEKETDFVERVRKGLAYANELSLTDTKAALTVIETIKEACKKEKRFDKYALTCSELAGIYYAKGDYINAIAESEKSINIFETVEETRPNLSAKAYANMWAGLSYSLINDWENAQQYLQASVNISEKAADSCKAANSTMNLAYIYYDMQDWKRMKEVLIKSSRFLKGCNDPDIELMTYSSLVIASARQNSIEDAKKYISEIQMVNKKRISTGLLIFYDAAKGEFAIAGKDVPEAVNMYTAAIKKATYANDPYLISFCSEGLGRAYVIAGNTVLAEKYFEEALSTAQKFNYLAQQQVALRSLSEFFAANGEYEKAWLYSNRLIRLRDSLAIKINAARRLLLDVRFETSKKENLISKLESEKKIQELTIRQKNILNYLLIGGVVTIFIISLLSYRNYKQKQKLQQQRIIELETQQQLTATEAVLKGEEQERTRLAKDLHDGLGGMLSGIKYSLNTMKGNLIMTPENAQAFERSMDMLDSSIQEMRRVAHNMMPETLVKYGLDTALKDFCNDITQSGVLNIAYSSIGLEKAVIEQTTAITIYRIVQELINNTIKHAVAAKAIVQVSLTNGLLSVTVEDDGKGFDTTLLNEAKGIGWENIKNRVEFLKGRLDVTSQQGKGTSVHIEFHS
jgi:signal transduction histidine kinase